MTGNSILARVECSFKGETVSLETVIDLDRHLANSEDAPDFIGALASAGGVDPYSYLYEVLESEEVVFSEPTGLAAQCLNAGRFDWRGFVQAARNAEDMAIVRAIAEREMGVTDLDADAGFKATLLAAMLAAYREGLRKGSIKPVPR